MRSMQQSLLRIFQTHTDYYPHSRPYFRSFRMQPNNPKIKHGRRSGLRSGSTWPVYFFIKTSSSQLQFQETYLRFKPVGFDDDKFKRRLARFVKKSNRLDSSNTSPGW